MISETNFYTRIFENGERKIKPQVGYTFEHHGIKYNIYFHDSYAHIIDDKTGLSVERVFFPELIGIYPAISDGMKQFACRATTSYKRRKTCKQFENIVSGETSLDYARYEDAKEDFRKAVNEYIKETRSAKEA